MLLFNVQLSLRLELPKAVVFQSLPVSFDTRKERGDLRNIWKLVFLLHRITNPRRSKPITSLSQTQNMDLFVRGILTYFSDSSQTRLSVNPRKKNNFRQEEETSKKHENTIKQRSLLARGVWKKNMRTFFRKLFFLMWFSRSMQYSSNVKQFLTNFTIVSFHRKKQSTK